MKRGDVAALLLALAAPGLAEGAVDGCEGLEISGAWIREAPPGATAVALYLQLRNTGSTAIVVDALGSPAFAHGMFHETVRDGDRVRMRHVERLTLAPGAALALAPGGMHGMLMRPAAPAPRAGEQIDVTLGCGGSSRQVTVPVATDAPGTDTTR